MFNNFNENIFTYTGVDLQLDPISPELVDRARPLFFGVSSDLLGNNFSDFVILFGNFLLIFLIQIIFSSLRKSSLAKQFFEHNKWDMLFGQIISMLVPSVLPWSFVLLKCGARNFSTKVNFLLNYLCLFVSIVFPIYYFFSLVEGQKVQLLEKKASISKSTTRLPRLITRRFDNIEKKITFGSLITMQVLAEWSGCMANFIYPLLVLLRNPLVFLVGVGLFTLGNVVFALRDLRRNKNYFVLNLYPLMFHGCFIIFFFSSSEKVLIYTEIVSLLCLLVGVAHFSLTAVIKIIQFGFKLLRAIFSNRKIEPLHPRNKRGSNEKLLVNSNAQEIPIKNHNSQKGAEQDQLTGAANVQSARPKQQKIVILASHDEPLAKEKA